MIELLTVIAIIGILAAILIPVVGRVRESARTAQCVSNMRQVGQGLLMYANDNHGFAPPGRDDVRHEESGGTGSTSLASTYFYVVWPYVYDSLDTLNVPDNTVTLNSGIENVFHCPTLYANYPHVRMAPAEMMVSGSRENFSAGRYSYGLNTMAAPRGSALMETPVNSMSAPSRTVAVVEMYYWYSNRGYYFDRFGVVPHNGSANFLFYDGHVERFNVNQIPGNDGEDPGDTIFWVGDNL